MKLGTRLTLIYLLIVSLSLLILGMLVTSLLSSHFNYDAGESLLAESRAISTLLEEDDRLNETNIQPLIDKISKDVKARVSIITLDGEVIADSKLVPSVVPNQAEQPEIKDAFKDGSGRSIRRSEVMGTDMLFVAVPLGANSKLQGIVRLAIPFSQVESAFVHVKKIGALGTAVAGAVAVILGFLFVRSITRPIKEMTMMAEQIAAGDLSPRSSVSSRDEVGKLAESLNIMADQLSARMKALINSQRRRQLLIDHMTDGVIMLGSRGSIVIANPAAQEMLSLRADLLVGRPLLEIINSDDLARTITMAARNDDVMKCTVVLGSRQQRIIRADVLSIREDEDEESFLVVFHDVTKESSLDRIRRDFVANFSHELKTPITGLKLLAETLSDAVGDGREEATYFADVIRDEISRLARFIEKLMDLAKLDSFDLRSPFERVAVIDAIEEVVQYCEPLAREKGLKIRIVAPDRLPLIKGESGQLRMLFQNLIENAIKYTANGDIRINAGQIGDWVEIGITDSGIGIAEQDLPRIFERFFRADKARSRETGGSGLGLSIVSKIVENHQGKVEVDSKLGAGTTFKVRLPIADLMGETDLTLSELPA